MAETKPKKEEAVDAVESNVAADKPKVSWEDKKVVVRLFLDNDKYKDDVTVVVNGKTWLIRRGVDVELPMYVWEVIEKGLEQDTKTAQFIQKEVDYYKQREKEFNF